MHIHIADARREISHDKSLWIFIRSKISLRYQENKECEEDKKTKEALGCVFFSCMNHEIASPCKNVERPPVACYQSVKEDACHKDSQIFSHHFSTWWYLVYQLTINDSRIKANRTRGRWSILRLEADCEVTDILNLDWLDCIDKTQLTGFDAVPFSEVTSVWLASHGRRKYWENSCWSRLIRLAINHLIVSFVYAVKQIWE